MVVGAYYAVTGTFDPNLLIVSLPVGLLVTAILHGNEWRDVAEDTRHGFTTFSAQVGREAAHWAEGHLRAIAMIDLMTARLHSAFGVLLLVGLVAGSAVR